MNCPKTFGAFLSATPLLAVLATAGSLLSAAPEILFKEDPSGRTIGKYERFEVEFLIPKAVAENFQWPYDPEPPPGVPPAVGISVDAVFTDPEGSAHRQPGFYFQEFRREIREGREWRYPTGLFSWRIRFSPNRIGRWEMKIVAQDQSGVSESEAFAFEVTDSDHRGFIRVSETDSRYFEFQEGSFFSGLGLNWSPNLNEPALRGGAELRELAGNGIQLARMWISSLFGSAWTPYIGVRNQYHGYIPRTGLAPVTDEATGERMLAVRLDYDRRGDVGWFDACRLGWSDAPVPVKPNTRYRISATYRAMNLLGPRARGRNFGFVIQFGGAGANCYEPGSGTAITSFGRSPDWERVSGSWHSGTRNFLPRMVLALQNAIEGEVYVRELSIREDYGDGSFGPEVLSRPSMQHHLYFPQRDSDALDQIVGIAERNGIHLKLVVMEKNDKIYLKLDDHGGFVRGGDNRNGFYGLGREVNQIRWIQQAWWRYLQARWGYSPAVFSWELTNEGDPGLLRHFEVADEFGKFMKCRVFGVEVETGDGSRCTYRHPNGHLVTTSFWHSFPASEFWSNPKYSNLDYADLHAYISTSRAPETEKRRMVGDAAYYHLWHSREILARGIGKPAVRGEAGLDVPGRQDERALGLDRDGSGVWLHNFLWSGLDSGGLYELYWWNSHIVNRHGDHRSRFKPVRLFLEELDLNRGGYRDWGGRVDNPMFRVVGQKNPTKGRMHLWIQNRAHTWRNVASGRSISPASGEITVPGFESGSSYLAEWWDTHASGKKILAVQEIAADAEGNLIFPVDALGKDVAVTVRRGEHRPHD